MDETRFDALTRALIAGVWRSPSRRVVLSALGASALAGLLGDPLAGEAKRNRRKKRNRKKKRKCLFGQQRCRDKRCHGCCSNADCGGNVCEFGRCSACPQDQRLCRDGCIPEDSCCSDSECVGGRVCVDGTCECKPNQRLCEGTCISASECCGDECPECGPENCNGCCDGHICRDGDSPNFCGRNGFICSECNFLQTCTGSFCACLRECCDNSECPGADRRCSSKGECESCIPDGTVPPGGCNIDTVGLCCSGKCGNPGGICGGGL